MKCSQPSSPSVPLSPSRSPLPSPILSSSSSSSSPPPSSSQSPQSCHSQLPNFRLSAAAPLLLFFLSVCHCHYVRHQLTNFCSPHNWTGDSPNKHHVITVTRQAPVILIHSTHPIRHFGANPKSPVTAHRESAQPAESLSTTDIPIESFSSYCRIKIQSLEPTDRLFAAGTGRSLSSSNKRWFTESMLFSPADIIKMTTRSRKKRKRRKEVFNMTTTTNELSLFFEGFDQQAFDFQLVVTAFRDPVDQSCGRGHFRCDNRRCIAVRLLCDHHDNCEDKTDEVHCRPPMVVLTSTTFPVSVQPGVSVNKENGHQPINGDKPTLDFGFDGHKTSAFPVFPLAYILIVIVCIIVIMLCQLFIWLLITYRETPVLVLRSFEMT